MEGTQTITQVIEIGADPDESTSDASVQILDTNGNVLDTICATAVAQRVE